MARDNRKENRQNAKAKAEGDNENRIPEGQDFSDIMELEETEAEEITDGLDISDDGDGDDETVVENADKSEAEKAAAKSVDNEDEEEGIKEEDEAKATDEAKKEADAKAAADEKLADDKSKEAEAKEPTDKPAPTSEKKEEAKEEKKEETKPEEVKSPEALTDEQAAELFTNWREETQKALAEHVYRLDDDAVAELNENPAAYIPKAMSRVYLDAISASFQQFVQYLPRMVHQVLEQREVIGKQENAFYEAWPALNDPKYKDTVLRMGATYRQTNPSASMEDFINEVGAQVMVALRLSPEKKDTNGSGKKQEQKAQPKSFKPAIDAPASSSQDRKTPSNPFEQMASEFGYEAEEIDDS